MQSSFKDGYADLITSAGHLLLLLVAWRINERPAWIICLGLIAAISFFAWMSTFRRNRAIADTPTAKVASAAQGYAELYGRAVSDPQYLAKNSMGGLPCVWYRLVVYRKSSNDKWQEVSREVSDTIFALEDGSGRCLIDPQHAEVITSSRRTWYEGDSKYVEEYLHPRDQLYALGDFITLGGAGGHLNLRQDVAELLAHWKRDQADLLQRFDLSGDGQLDLREWTLARRAAAREVEKQHRELHQQPGVHVLRAPASGRLYLLSNLSPQQLGRKYVLWGWFHLVVFFAAGAAAVWLTL